jgi:hypothetical protein
MFTSVAAGGSRNFQSVTGLAVKDSVRLALRFALFAPTLLALGGHVIGNEMDEETTVVEEPAQGRDARRSPDRVAHPKDRPSSREPAPVVGRTDPPQCIVGFDLVAQRRERVRVHEPRPSRARALRRQDLPRTDELRRGTVPERRLRPDRATAVEGRGDPERAERAREDEDDERPGSRRVVVRSGGAPHAPRERAGVVSLYAWAGRLRLPHVPLFRPKLHIALHDARI